MLTGATVANVFAMLPLFLVGALAVFVRDELAFSETELGLAVAVFSLFATATTLAGGRLAERIGTSQTIRLGLGTSAAGLAGIALFAVDWWSLCAGLAVAGVGNALIQPATNGALARGIPHHRQALAFGVKQSSLPIAGSVAGLAVPAIGLTLGWRWAFGLAALAALTVVAVVPSASPVATASSDDGNSESRSSRTVSARTLVVLAGAGLLGAAAANSLMAFFVESLVAAGVFAGVAGTLLAVGGASGVVARIYWGWRADRNRGRDLVIIATLLATGSSGYVLLAAATGFPLPEGGLIGIAAAGTVLCFAAGWGWPGLYAYAVARRNPARPAAATGVTQTGIFAGALTGPPVFGLTVTTLGYSPAYLLAALACVVAAGFIVAGRARLATESARRTASATS